MGLSEETERVSMRSKITWFGDKVYVVTGSTQGIGAAVALALAEAGACGLVICGRNRDNGARVKAAIEDRGAVAEYVCADLGRVDDCWAVMSASDRRFRRVDGLVNAAGLTARGTLENTTSELWDLLFAVNARAPFLLMQGAIAMMRRDGVAGSIVNIISMSSHGGPPYLTPYSASKGALVTLTRNVAHAVRFDGIRVNGLNIGWTDTPNEHKVKLSERRPADWLVQAEAGRPFGRLIKPEDLAQACLFLLGPMSGIMTGSIIDYDQNVLGTWDSPEATKSG